MPAATEKNSADPQSNRAPQRERQPAPSDSLDAIMARRALADPQSVSPQTIIALQRTIGNQAVQRLIQRKSDFRPSTPPVKSGTSGSSAAIQRDLKPGDKAPSIEEAAKERFSDRLENAKQSNNFELKATTTALGDVQKALGSIAGNPTFASMKTTAPTNTVQLVWGCIQGALKIMQEGGGGSWDEFSALIDMNIGTLFIVHGGVTQMFGLSQKMVLDKADDALVGYIVQARRAEYKKIQNPELKASALASDPSKPLTLTGEEVATQFLRNKSTAALASPSFMEKRSWAADLKKMPTIAALIADTLFQAPLPSVSPIAWTFPASPADATLYDEGTKSDSGQLPDGHALQTKIKEAWVRIQNLVDSAVLNQTRAPRIRVHPSDDFRAYYSDQEEAIHVAQNEEVPVIVHEFGHHLENTLPSELWLGVQRLLHSRHDSKRKGMGLLEPDPDTLVSIGADSSAPMGDEPRYRAEMPVTKEYSAKAYLGGDTEVVSMSMEYFSQPAKAKELIEGDPQQAAIILRQMQPKEYRDYVGITWNHLLP